MSKLYDFPLEPFFASDLLNSLSSFEGKKLVIIWSMLPIAFVIVFLNDCSNTACAVGEFEVRCKPMIPFGSREGLSLKAGRKRSLLRRAGLTFKYVQL